MRVKTTYLIFVFSVFLGIFSHAQDQTYNGNPDESFYKAQDLAFQGKRSIARDTLKHILTKYPNYSDVRNLLASTYSWDGKYNEARRHFNRVTSKDRKNKDAWVAAIMNEIYAKEYNIALGLANKALGFIEKDTALSLLREKVLSNIQGDFEKRKSVIPKKPIENKEYKNRIGISTSYDIFDIAYDPMIYSSMEYRRETKIGSFIPRINYSNRFDTQGTQFEIDAYPKLTKKLYAFTSYAYSNSPIYPNHNARAELYANLPKGIEVSVGLRLMDFNNTKANIITGSAGLYKGNYYLSLRPYITHTKNKPVGVSGTLLGRNYLKDDQNYLGVLLGYGFSPELKQLRDGDEVLAQTLLYVESQQLILEYQFSGNDQSNLYRTSLGITRQELAYDSGTFFWSLSVGFAYQVKF